MASTSLSDSIVVAFSSTGLDLTLGSQADTLARLVEYAGVFGVDGEGLAAGYEACAMAAASSTTSGSSGTSAPSSASLLSALHASLVASVDSQRGVSKNVVAAATQPKPAQVDDAALMAMLGDTADPIHMPHRKARLRTNEPSQLPPRTPLKHTQTNQNYSTPTTQRTPAHKQITTPAAAKTPSQQIQLPKFAASPSLPLLPFADRKNKGKVEEVFNPHVPLMTNNMKQGLSARQVEIALPPGQQMDGYRYMFERLAEKGDLVDARIQDLSLILDRWVYENIVLNQKLDMDEEPTEALPASYLDADGEPTFLALQNPSIPHNTPFFTAGRIVHAVDSSPGNNNSNVGAEKLSKDSLVLETCRLLGGGSRIPLQLSDALLQKGAHFFPGMVVALSGMNPTGKCVIVEDVFEIPRLEFAATNVQRLVDMYDDDATSAHTASDTHTRDAKVVNLLIAAGPYSVDVAPPTTGAIVLPDAPSYEPLHALADVACREKPDVLLLCGPFVDESLPGWKSGLYTLSCENVFRRHIVPVLKRVAEASPHTKIVLVPSGKGLESEWVGYPQPPVGSSSGGEEAKVGRWKQFGIKELVAAGKVVLVPNPVQLMVNEVVVCVSNVDSLLHVSGQVLDLKPTTPGATPTDRLSLLFNTHLTQRTLYPLHPPPLSDPNFTLDHTRAASGSIHLQATPDLLILPSLLKETVRSVDGCVCVNPGFVVKGRGGGGSFARVCVYPMDVDGLKGLLGDAGKGGDGGAGGKRKGGEEGEVGEVGERVVENAVGSRCRVEVQKV
ncbi:DNA-directed DNA polymerase alpha subunit pol12 [Podochytrium sp. JEL0797]|nr:DNA-directed DNA polymerase alpha subunit pol12 [Podochytrium sp. JEL0797]